MSDQNEHGITELFNNILKANQRIAQNYFRRRKSRRKKEKQKDKWRVVNWEDCRTDR